MSDGKPESTTDLPWAIAGTPEDLGRFVSTHRISSGWTRRDLAEHLGFPVRHLHEIEGGQARRCRLVRSLRRQTFC